MEQAGIVIAVKENTALVRMRRHLACENCGRCGGLLGKVDLREPVVEVLNPVGARPGQRVLVESDDRRVLLVSFMLYIVPLAALVTGIFLWLKLASLYGLGGGEPAAAGSGFALMILVFLGLRFWDRHNAKNPRYKPVITEILAEKSIPD